MLLLPDEENAGDPQNPGIAKWTGGESKGGLILHRTMHTPALDKRPRMERRKPCLMLQ
jgi:hypothetical protein